MATVDIHRLVKRYGAEEVIHGIDLAIRDGEFISLIGASGCGKSTLLRMIAGLEDISGGTISIDGREVNDVAPKNRDIAMVFQNYALYPHLSVADNMGFSLKLRDVPKPEIARAVKEAADLLGLTPYLDRMPKALSGGQRQRVAMGRAIVRKPRVFLFDEPLSNLDAKLRVQMRTEIKALQRRLGTTSIYVTHDQIEAMTMSDRIVILNGGRVEQVGAPLDVYDRPGNLFVATFIGSPAMNLIEATTRHDGDRLFAETDDGLRLPLDGYAMANEAEVTVGIRPEHFAFTDAGAPGALPIAVDLIEPTGHETHVFGRLGRHQVVVAHSGRVAEAASIFVTIAPGGLHLFDRTSGRRINTIERT
ncbi:ABC transporter [Pleomorphomonas diazotrophica]|uniref:ABC transporter n=1 Tax=Pleomorphomonas diazotrophica TaxID=1166257 RepID=A0A1I4S3K4_9HYPH|nr:sn-glycerol-3-phosphate ABC transporter ATP-binding protein UgpC [Pleomorphomonas diazotrophica]PKR89995.1 ABC transporter [Pleomorphomonas diazotrophica]SFM59078.1 multiple sugar transport system ATP-binding protein [Pleomorphomonas diazotrophica]